MAKSKDTKAVAPSGKRPRGRPRKFHSVEEQKSSVHASGVNHGVSGVAPAVDHGGGGDGDRRVGKVKGMSKEEDLLKDILLGNSSDNQESGQVYTCVAAAVSIRLLSHAVGGVCEIRRHLKRVCNVRVSEATTDVCILHGSWLNIAKAKLFISQCLQRQGAGNMERLEGQGTNNTPGTNIKEELGTGTSPDLQIIERQDRVNTPDTEIIEGQGKVNSPASQSMEGAGDTCGTRHKRPACSPAEDAPSVKRDAGNVFRQLTDNNCVTEEITPPIGDVTVKRSTRTRRPTFSSSEWATPHGSPRRGSKEGEKTNKSKCRTALSSQSIRGSRSRKQSEDPLLRDPTQQNGCVSDVGTAGNGHLDLKQEPDVPSERPTMKEETDPHEGVIKHDIETSQDATHTGILPNSISSEIIQTVASREGSLAGGSTETVGVNVSPEATLASDRTNKSEADTPISHSDDSDRPVSNGQKCEVFSTVCEICGFKSATAQGLVNHKGNYHSVVMYECDICFRRFGYKNVRDRHRGSHLHDDGTLKESALIVHQMALKKQCRIENLSPELLCGAAGAVCVNAGVEENGSTKLVEHLLDWERKGEREEGLVGKPPKNADNKTEDHCLGSEVKEQLQEVDIPRDGAGGKELKTDALQENVELSSVCGSGQTGSQPRLYECELCGARLTQAYYLKKHYEAVHYSGRQRKKTDSVRNQLGRRNDTAYACPHCTFVCYRIQNFTRHVDSHRQPALHHCQLCNYSNKLRGEVARHMRNAHGEKKFKCHLCGCVFRTQILLNCHVKQKHEKSRRTVCEICGKVLMTRKSYYKHKELYHGDEAVVGKVMCQTCGRVLNSQKLYDAHWRKCHGEDANNEEEREIGQALQILSNGHFQCRHCLYKNAVAREVRRHIIRVHAEKKFKCDHCSAAFPRQSFLNKHVRIQHQGAEKAQCGQCKKVFKNYVNLKAHMNRIHLEDKPYQCSVCLRAFFDKRTLVMHMDLHRPEDERDWKFECKPCGRHFRFKCNYEYHMQDHTGQRPHVCATCNKAFKTKSMMETHMTVHSDERPYSCSQCGKRFKLQKYLDVHVLTHASEKVCCAACGKIFGKPDDLKKHICRAIPVAATGIEGDSTGLGLVGSAGELRQINMEELSVLGDGTTVTAILVEQHEGDDSGANIGDCLEVTDSDTHMVIEQQALVCETAEGSQLFPLADTAGDESRLDDTAVAMYMCGLCRKLYATQEEINDHMQEHIDVDVECEGDKLLAQLEASSDDTGEVPAVTVEEVGLDTTGTVAYM